MNIGTISTRYARALYSLALDEGTEDMVYIEVKSIQRQFKDVPEIKQYISSPTVTKEEKIKLLTICAGGESISKVMREFISFIVKRDKDVLLQFMCVAYNRVYRKAKNIRLIKLVSASEVDNELIGGLCAKIGNKYGGSIELESAIDESIIGGFVVSVDNNRMDSSVLGELMKIREDLKKRKQN